MSEHTDETTSEEPAVDALPTAERRESTSANPAIHAGVVGALRDIFDPEIPVNIYDLGLIYSVEVDENDRVAVTMTLTSPACPVAGSLPGEVEEKVASVEGVSSAWVDLVWDPPWGPEHMSEEARLTLGFF